MKLYQIQLDSEQHEVLADASKKSGMSELSLILGAVVQYVGTCAWGYDEEDDAWISSCGEMWTFQDGGPEENRMRHCHWCGKRTVIRDD